MKTCSSAWFSSRGSSYLWLKHLEWYIKAVSDYSLPLQYLLSPPLVLLSTSRGRRRVHIFRDGLIFKLYDRLRTSPAPFGGVASKVVLVRHCWYLVGRVVFFTSIRRSKDQTLGASERRLSVAKTGSGCKQNCWRTGITKATIRIKEVRLVLALGGAGSNPARGWVLNKEGCTLFIT